MALSKSAQAALLKWVNTFDGLDRKAETLDDLTDGVILAQVLHILNPDFESSSLNQHPKTSLEKKRNLETVYRALAQFLRQDNPYLAPSPNQFRTIIDKPDPNGMCEFLSAFVSAACLGDLAKIHVPAIMKMDRPDQREIMAIIQKKQIHIKEAEARAQANGGDDDDPSSDAFDETYTVSPAPRDPDLAREAEMARLSKELDTLRKQNADLLTRNEQLQMSREDIMQDLQIAQRERDLLQKTNESDAAAIIRKLEAEKREEEHLIDTLQAQAEEDRLDKIRLRNELQAYKTKAEKAEEFHDQVKELLHEKESLASKLKQAEWYKKSAEEAKITEQRNRELETQNHDLREMMQEFDKMRADNEALKYTCSQYRKQMETYEREKYDDQAIKQNLKEENESMKLERQILTDQLRVSEEQMRDMQERLHVSAVSPPPSSPGAGGLSSNLEDELSDTGGLIAKLKRDVSQLQAENRLLKNNMGVAAENERLRTDLDIEKKKQNLLQMKYNEVYEKWVVGQEQLKALVAKNETDDALRDIQKGFFASQEQLEKVQAELKNVQSELADRERELMASKTDLTAVGQESIEALEVLKSSDQLVSASLKAELEATRKRLETKEIDLEQLQRQLMDALLSKDKIRQQLDEAKAAGLLTSTPARSPTPDQAAAGLSEKDYAAATEKTEKLKTALKQKIQVSDDDPLAYGELTRYPSPTTSLGSSPEDLLASHIWGRVGFTGVLDVFRRRLDS
ncbi:hypothetical protein DL546_000495 [Coniochaeta pulveracea]|uniref:Calponin-homology (CH) domain-containing protein n=1 Tax=Coniochaeta pulveracea TaxID=177199 RepID=A0A420Y7S4_9PEZI|nr:hypothetical protein DL546_000495 [Coniochaeta pulveracea]